jgi:hypothetical protein
MTENDGTSELFKKDLMYIPDVPRGKKEGCKTDECITTRRNRIGSG